MWSFFGSKLLEGDTSSLWHELGTKDANKKTPNIHLLLCFGQVEVIMAQDVEWVYCFERGQKIPQAWLFLLPMWQVVMQGNLLASSILFLGANFFFSFFFQDFPSHYILLVVVWNWSTHAIWCNSLRFFFGCERGSGYEIFSLIYITMEVGNMGDLFFWGVQV